MASDDSWYEARVDAAMAAYAAEVLPAIRRNITPHCHTAEGVLPSDDDLSRWLFDPQRWRKRRAMPT